MKKYIPPNVKKLAKDAFRAGPCLVSDSKGGEYLAYRIYVRDGAKDALLTFDEELIKLNKDNVLEIFERSIENARADMWSAV